MTINDLRCDRCGRHLLMPGDGVRFVYHPGVPELRDDSGLTCSDCWSQLVGGFGAEPGGTSCAVCQTPVPRNRCLHVRRFDDPGTWRLCAAHAVEFLNSLQTVEPKLDAATFRFPGE